MVDAVNRKNRIKNKPSILFPPLPLKSYHPRQIHQCFHYLKLITR